MKLMQSAAIATLTLGSIGAQAAPTIFSEAFEGALNTNWTVTGGAPVIVPSIFNAGADNDLRLNSGSPAGQITLSTALATTSGTLYTIDFDYAIQNVPTGGGTGAFSATISPGSIVPTSTAVLLNFSATPLSTGLTHFSGTFIASGLATSLVFQGGGGADVYLDDIYIKEVPGPIPVFGALAAFGWSRRLRNRIRQTTV